MAEHGKRPTWAGLKDAGAARFGEAAGALARRLSDGISAGQVRHGNQMIAQFGNADAYETDADFRVCDRESAPVIENGSE